jgi:hypothetical protein
LKTEETTEADCRQPDAKDLEETNAERRLKADVR